MFTSQQLQKWRNRNLYYYQDIENLCKFFVQPGARVLEVGSKLGHLLNSVQPGYGLGVDSNVVAIERAREKYPSFEFEVIRPEDFVSDQLFDYIILANTISSLNNIQKVFAGLHKVCHPSTRLIITFHNPAWEFILRLATIFKQRMPLSSSSLNWLNLEDVENILSLTDFDVIEHGKRFLFPKKIPFLSNFLNKFIAPLPLFNSFCLTEYVIARPFLNRNPDNHKTFTCSVVVPARNESNNIEGCVARMPKLGKHTEIIFVEGYSKDDTWSEIQRIQSKYKDDWDIKICQQTGKGKGNAVREGFAIATGDIFIILDSDLTVRPEDLIYFFDAITSARCEFANGCRLIYPVSSDAMPWLNRMANRFFAWLLSYLLNVKIKDSLCGTKAIKKEHYEKIVQNRSYFGDFDPFGDFDLLFGSSKLGLRIQDIPVRYVPRSYGQSNIQHFKEGLVLLKMCLYAAEKIKFI